MRSIALVASAALLLGGLAPELALAQGCAGQGEANRLLAGTQGLTAPIGRRYVVSALWDDQPATVEGETRITNALYQDLRKLSRNGAVLLKRIRYSAPGDGWDVHAAVIKGLSDLVDVTPGAIASEPSYRQRGDTFSVDRFAYTNLQVVSVNELKSSTDRYCVVQFTYRATYTPLLAVLADAPGDAQRKGRLLGQVDPYARGWRILTYDFAPQDQPYTTTKVPDAVKTLALAR